MRPIRIVPPARQRGLTLIMALIMLVVLTLLALVSFNVGNATLIIVSNMQQRDENVAAAREVLEEAISTTRLFETPDAVLQNPCHGVANQRCVDVNGDGTADVNVQLETPDCIKVKAVKVATLDLTEKEDQGCSRGENNGTDLFEDAPAGNSECADTVWELRANARDATTGAAVGVVQGVAVRVSKDDVITRCPAT
jgi:Tfp pilus assembly protein PilX